MGKYTLIISLVLVVFCNFALGRYSGGTGEPNDPYLIATPNDLNNIGLDSNDWDKSFLMTADINMAEYTGTQFNIIGYCYGCIPEVNCTEPFTGVFDGNGHTISNFTYSTIEEERIAIFGCVAGKNAEIKNLGLIDPNINAIWFVGSLVAGNGGKIRNCYVTGGNITGEVEVGGLVSGNSGTIVNCYSNTDVSGTDTWTGGLVCSNWGVIQQCYTMGSVSGNKVVGGLVGVNDDFGVISNCYSSALVSGSEDVGGLVGSGGGIVGNSYWDVQSSGQTKSAGGFGRTTEQMKSADTYIGWSCYPVWTIDDGNDYPKLWYQNLPGQPLPTQTLSDFLEGEGTESSPYLIYTPEDLEYITLFSCEWDRYFKLMTDIDMTDGDVNNLTPIGYCAFPFTGSFDGNHHTISNLTHTSFTHHSGFLGQVGIADGASGFIKDLGLINPVIDSGDNGEFVGSLVGCLGSGSVNRCFVDGGSVSGNDYIGGLVGSSKGDITNCYSNSDVNGVGSVYTAYSVGGLLGNNEGSVTNCYVTTQLTDNYPSSSSEFGGLVGRNSFGTISNCYAEGFITTDFSDCIGGLVGLNEYGTVNSSYAMVYIETGVMSWSISGLVGENDSGTINQCFALGDVNVGDDSEDIGGLVGRHEYGGSIFDCFATGNVTAGNNSRYVGGLVGNNYLSSIEHSYSAGIVSGDDDVGGFVGYDDNGEYTASFWDVDVNPDVNGIGNTTDPNVMGRTTAQMQNEATFTDYGWDFVGESINGPNDVWTIKEGVKYPEHIWPVVQYMDWDGVDFADYSYFSDWWMAVDCNDVNDCNSADLDYSGGVDANDLDIFSGYWLFGK